MSSTRIQCECHSLTKFQPCLSWRLLRLQSQLYLIIIIVSIHLSCDIYHYNYYTNLILSSFEINEKTRGKRKFFAVRKDLAIAAAAVAKVEFSIKQQIRRRRIKTFTSFMSHSFCFSPLASPCNLLCAPPTLVSSHLNEMCVLTTTTTTTAAPTKHNNNNATQHNTSLPATVRARITCAHATVCCCCFFCCCC